VGIREIPSRGRGWQSNKDTRAAGYRLPQETEEVERGAKEVLGPGKLLAHITIGLFIYGR